MNKLTPQSFVRKAWLVFKKQGKVVARHHFTVNSRIMVNLKATRLIHRGYSCTVIVKYRDGSQNSGTYEKVGDVKWAIHCFIIEYLNGNN